MGDMTHVDWQRIREQSRSAVVGQATFFARGDLVDTLAMRKGARDDQPYREIVTDAEADAVFSFAEQVGRDVGGDLEARIAAIVANNALFPRQSP